jgi:hypothetical protein
MAFDGLKTTHGDLYSLTSIGTNTGTIVSSSEAVLHALFWHVAGSTAAVVTVYDAATIATSDTTTDKLVIKGDAFSAGDNVPLDAVFATGIVVKNEGGTPGTVLVTHRKL